MTKVLLVEDDNNLREIYEARLLAEGYEVVTAKDGEDALTVVKGESPNLIIADVMMPRISGFEMLDILRNTGGITQPKVIMLTALGQDEDREHANGIGADRYLIKSQVTLEDIVHAAQELMNPDTAEAAPAAAPQPSEADVPEFTVPEPVLATVPTDSQDSPLPAAAQPLQPVVEPVATVIDEPVATVDPVAPADDTASDQDNDTVITEAAEALQAPESSPLPSIGAQQPEVLAPSQMAGAKVIEPVTETETKPDIMELLAQHEQQESTTEPEVEAAAPAPVVEPAAPAPIVETPVVLPTPEPATTEPVLETTPEMTPTETTEAAPLVAPVEPLPAMTPELAPAPTPEPIAATPTETSPSTPAEPTPAVAATPAAAPQPGVYVDPNLTSPFVQNVGGDANTNAL